MTNQLTVRSEPLNPYDERFLQLFVTTRSEGWSYRRVFDPDANKTTVAHENCALKLLSQKNVQDRLQELRKEQEETGTITLTEVIRRWLEIATADPDEIIGLRIGCCRYCRGDGHGYQWREREYVEALARWEQLPEPRGPIPDIAGGFGFDHTLPPVDDCPECRGEGLQRIVARDTSKLTPQGRLLYQGVKYTRWGIEIQIADRTKALEQLTRILGGYKNDDTQRGVFQIAQLINVIQTGTVHDAEEAYMRMIKGT